MRAYRRRSRAVVEQAPMCRGVSEQAPHIWHRNMERRRNLSRTPRCSGGALEEGRVSSERILAEFPREQAELLGRNPFETVTSAFADRGWGGP